MTCATDTAKRDHQSINQSINAMLVGISVTCAIFGINWIEANKYSMLYLSDIAQMCMCYPMHYMNINQTTLVLTSSAHGYGGATCEWKLQCSTPRCHCAKDKGTRPDRRYILHAVYYLLRVVDLTQFDYMYTYSYTYIYIYNSICTEIPLRGNSLLWH